MATHLYDVANAFPPLDLDRVKLRHRIEDHHEAQDAQLLCKHVEDAICTIDTPEGTLDLKPGSGVLQGSSSYWGIHRSVFTSHR
eukprot:2088531-Heterocapsa_arctica.AAC.1